MQLAGKPVLQAARDYWRDLPKPVNIPDFRLIDPLAIPRIILPHVLIAEIARSNFDLGQLRLCGHEIARWFRDMPEGMSTQDFAALTDAAYIRHMRDLLAELIQRRRPLYCQSVYTLPPDFGAAPAPAPAAAAKSADAGSAARAGALAVAEPPAAAATVVTAERVVLPLADGGVAVECVIMVEILSVTGPLAGAGPLPLLPPTAGVAVSHGPFELVA